MLRVAPYIRVSTLEEDQQKSYMRMAEELSDFIKSQEDWELVDLYGDRGKTGTEASKRKDYQRLLKDVEAGKLDVVVIKDETRLDRNTLSGLQFVQTLIKNNCKLYFYLNKEFYNPAKDELPLTIKFAVAAHQSRHLSNNINNATKKRQMAGRILTNGKIWGYTQIKKEARLEIHPEEAKIVKFVFESYASGKGFRTIEREVKDMITDEIKKRRKIDSLPMTSLKRMISQTLYKGTCVMNKKHKNFETKKIEDVPESEWIVKHDVCPIIIEPELWDKCNEILEGKRKVFAVEEKKKLAGYWSGTYSLSSKIFCEKCGQVYWHQKYNNNKGTWQDVFQCSTYRKFKKSACNAPTVSSEYLISACQKAIYNFNEIGNEAINAVIAILKEALTEPEKNDKEIQRLTTVINKLNKRLEGYEDMRADGEITKEKFQEKKDEILTEIEKYQKEIKGLESVNVEVIDKIKRLESVKLKLENKFSSAEDIDEEIIKEMVSKIVVGGTNKAKTLEITLVGDYVENVHVCPVRSISGPEILPR